MLHASPALGVANAASTDVFCNSVVRSFWMALNVSGWVRDVNGVWLSSGCVRQGKSVSVQQQE